MRALMPSPAPAQPLDPLPVVHGAQHGVRAKTKEEKSVLWPMASMPRPTASIARLMMLSTPVTSSTGTTKSMPPIVGVPVLT
jgi:hypothetical protein